MKAGATHAVPLTDRAIEILRRLHEMTGSESDYIFPGTKVGKSLSNMAMSMALRRMSRNDITVHGFRSAFSNWAMKETYVRYEIREQALAHQAGSKIERTYRTDDLFDERRDLMARWANHIEGRTADVVPLERRAS
jgi:integrase